MAKNKPKKRRKLIVLCLIFLALAGLTVTALLKRKEVVIAVQVEEVKRRSLTEIVLADGRIQPVIQVKISPEVSGEIIQLPVREGQKVNKGEILVQIKPDFYEANVRRSEAGHQQSIAGLKLSQAEQDKAELELARVRKMFETKIVSVAQFDEANTAYEVAESRTVQARHQVEMAMATLSSAKEDLAKTTILSPLTGTVSQLNSELGERVLGTAQNMGTEIMVIADLNQMEARVEIGEVDVVLIKPHQIAKLEVDAFRDREFTGIVTEIGNSALTRSGGSQQQATKFEVRIKINQREEFRPGMSVSADIETRYRTNVLAVPIQSVTRRVPESRRATAEDSASSTNNSPSSKQSPKVADADPVDVVFLAKEGKAVMAAVTRGISDDDYVEITQGLEEGDVAITGSYRAIDRDLKDGAPIDIRPKDSTPEEKDDP